MACAQAFTEDLVRAFLQPTLHQGADVRRHGFSPDGDQQFATAELHTGFLPLDHLQPALSSQVAVGFSWDIGPGWLQRMELFESAARPDDPAGALAHRAADAFSRRPDRCGD